MSERIKGTWGRDPLVKDLPEPYFSQAMANLDEGRTEECPLYDAFEWDATNPNQGYDYWEPIYQGYYPEGHGPSESTKEPEPTPQGKQCIEIDHAGGIVGFWARKSISSIFVNPEGRIYIVRDQRSDGPFVLKDGGDTVATVRSFMLGNLAILSLKAVEGKK